MAGFPGPAVPKRTGPRVLVVGAGAFGGWTALHLLRSGAQVTLADAWGPGNSRSSSGGETRILRAAYADRVYAEMAVRALEIWKEEERRWNRRLFVPCGVIRLASKAHADSEKYWQILREAGVKHERLSPQAARSAFPQFDFQGVDWVLFEPQHGMLRARRGCEAVWEAFVAEGGRFEQRQYHPGNCPEVDAVVWACGPWLEKLFPGVGPVVSTRQEVFFFGTPPGKSIYSESQMPCWIDDAIPRFHFYGTPGNDWRGLKIGDDAGGVPFDPDDGERRVSDARVHAIREYLRIRFPKLADAPLLESRVCQYESTPDRHLILDRHPTEPKFWIAGGGSGHGYKLGAAVGERMAAIVLGKRDVDPFFSIQR
jgi:glycine/D-amino acid oxidase-like deaminating enzyme